MIALGGIRSVEISGANQPDSSSARREFHCPFGPFGPFGTLCHGKSSLADPVDGSFGPFGTRCHGISSHGDPERASFDVILLLLATDSA